MSLAEKLVFLRKQKGLTQMDLAEQLNVSRQAISRWEVGAAIPSTENLKVLGELFGVPVDYLLNDDVTGNPENTQEPADNPIDRANILKSVKLRPIVIFCIAVVVAVAVFVLVLIPRSNRQDRSIPMEGMHTESKEDYSEGTFEYK